MQYESRPRSPDLVVNWHVTEACNYRCAYCYAHWDRLEGDEVIRDPRATERLLRSIHEAFGTGGKSARVRLNFAGGEPLLFAKQMLAAMRFAAGLGFDLSLITNGSRRSPVAACTWIREPRTTLKQQRPIAAHFGQCQVSATAVNGRPQPDRPPPV